MSDLIRCATQYLGVPYRWAGQNRMGMDCSGFILTCLSDVGIILPDMTANQIYYWHRKRSLTYDEPSKDTLLYFGKNEDSISHIAIAIDDKWMIESGGAAQETKDMSYNDLLIYCAQKKAGVRYKKINKRNDLMASMAIEY